MLELFDDIDINLKSKKTIDIDINHLLSNPFSQRLLCKCCMIYIFSPTYDIIKFSQCLCKCYIPFNYIENRLTLSSKFSPCLCECYMIFYWKSIDIIKFSQCLCKLTHINMLHDMSYSIENRLTLSSSHNVYANVIWYSIVNRLIWYC
jgi:hypothetical protein